MLHLFKFKPNPLIISRHITQKQLLILHFHPILNSATCTAIAASKIQHESPKTEDPLLDFFHSYGFTDTQIKRFFYKNFSARSIDTIKPKLDYLLAFGFSPSMLIRMICYDHNILVASLKERIEPNLSFLEATLGSKADVIKTINRCAWLLRINLDRLVIPNLNMLKKMNIPTETITRLFATYPRVLGKDTDIITEALDKLKELRVSPSSRAFICGMNCMTMLKKETWERKLELYRSFGWSETDTFSAFARQPTCMLYSEEKIIKIFKFFIDKLDWDSDLLLRRPVVLTYSLEGRIIPRCVVLNELAKNGLWNGKPEVYTLLNMSKENFEEGFVDKYEKEVPRVIDAYRGKMDFVGFESGF